MTKWVLQSVVWLAIAIGLLVHVAHGTTPPVVRGNENITIDNSAPFLQLQDAAKATIKKGAKVSHFQASGNSEIVLEDGSEVSHLTVSGGSVLHVSGGTVSFLTLEGNSQAHIRHINIRGGIFSVPGVSVSGGAIVYTSSASLHIYADNMALEDGKLTGNWSTGARFSIWVIERIGSGDSVEYLKPQSLPAQLVAHELPGPSFDCNKAALATEKAVCADKELARLDKQLSQTYKQVLAASSNADEIRLSQKNWLIGQRNKCRDSQCLKTAYSSRISEMVSSARWMTNAKAQAICNAIVDAVNDGTIGRRFQSFQTATQEEREIWKESQPNLSMFYLNGTLKINSNGKVRTIGMIQGGGTCSNCDIVDIAAKETALYPPDDEKERFRWAGWGQCDRFLFVEDEPIVVTGRFGWGESSASLVTWLAPDGAKRALCYLGPSEEIKTKTVRDENPELCQAAAAGNVKSLS